MNVIPNFIFYAYVSVVCVFSSRQPPLLASLSILGARIVRGEWWSPFGSLVGSNVAHCVYMRDRGQCIRSNNKFPLVNMKRAVNG